MIHFATIGTNFITDRFVQAASQCRELSFAGVYSRREETAKGFADKYGVEKIYTDLQALAEDDSIQGIYIASPNALHCSQALLMLEHGKHVLCEKPGASNAREWGRMAEAARENQAVLLEAMRSVYDPGFAAIRENLGKIGQIRRASFQFCQYSSRYDKYKAGIIENAFKPELSNGALMDIGVYCVHPLVRLFGMPQEVEGNALLLENGVDGEGTVFLKYSDMLAELVYSKITDSQVPSQIQGEKGCMLLDRIEDTRRITLIFRDGRREEISVEKPANNMVYEAKAWSRFMEALERTRAGEELGCAELEEALRCTELELAVMDLARKRMGIRFPADKGE